MKVQLKKDPMKSTF